MLVERPKKLGSTVSERHTAGAGTEQVRIQARQAGENLPAFPSELFLSRTLLEGSAYCGKGSFP